MSLNDIANTAARIAEAASAVPMRYFRQGGLGIETKDDGDNSPVTIADRETETAIRAALAHAFPGHGVFGEEFGTQGSLDGPAWIIDPIDGTRFFLTGYPAFGMLIGHLQAGVPQVGIVRMPALGETFAGIRGGAATWNGAPISVRATTRLEDALLFVNEPERTHAADPALFARLCRAGYTRRMSYDCYPHAMVAAGQIDAVTDMGLEPYDFMPLVPLVEAAGGVITDWQGRALSLGSDGRVVTAAGAALHAQLLELLNG
ncbi:inositol monophosphatase [Pelagivirga sediminicola]|uniref:Inositol monophosphatase n=1 Tax=Pelagivirga sediminicola TaxID=2170575 RepID=A0A2T7GBF7_9RHOB|nr:inositol monophosphatase family protein [Pelagivirga sediminicola]PVA11736.1 inositol monophosphatase [Pelagivirga sediminicola]